MKKSRARLTVWALVLALGLGSATYAYASSATFGANLPEVQGNITLASAQRSSAASASIAVSTSSIGNGQSRYWAWGDKGSAGTRATDSYYATRTATIYMPYYSSWSGTALLRGCTDGWVSGLTYVGGTVNFG
jgi:hypothetical protein